MSVRLFFFACVAFFGIAFGARGQGSTDILRGRVTADGIPIPGARVTVTDRESNTSRTSKAGDDGRYTVLFPDGSGDYDISVVAMGYKPTKVSVSMPSDEDLLVTDLKLDAVPKTVLDAVTINGAKRPQADGTEDHSAGSSEQSVDPIASNTVATLDNGTGDLLSKLAASIPGVLLTPGENGGPPGFSVLGNSASQNNVTVDGTTFNGGIIPRDALGSVRLATTTYDPSRGNFSGGQLSVSTRRGNNFSTRSLRMTLAEPSLTFANAAARAFQPPHADRQVAGTAGGSLIPDKILYFGSLQVSQQSSDQTTLLDAGNSTLQRAGIAPDSVTRVLQLLSGAGIPATGSAIPGSSVNTSTSGILRLDFPRSGTATTTLTLMETLQRQSGTGLSPLATPAGASEGHGNTTRVELQSSNYFGGGFLHELRTSYDRATNQSNPYLEIPGGSVRIGSTLPDGTAGVSTLTFGGGAGATRSSSQANWEADDEMSWISFDNKHRYKLSVQLAHRAQRATTSNGLGTFYYNSLADLQANVPSSFSRTFSQLNNAAGGTTLGLSLGDGWRPTQKLRIEYGARVDYAWTMGQPVYNALVDSVFGVRNDYVPRSVGFSPRLGFTYQIGGSPPMSRTELRRKMEQATAAGGNARNFFFNTGSQLRGGIGAFHGPIEGGLITQAANATGLPGGVSQLSCVGAAVPQAQWALYSGNPGIVPAECQDGTGTQYLGGNQPNVVVLSRGLQSPTSWRANLGWQGKIKEKFNLGVEATYSLGVNQQDATDLNFLGLPAFNLANELGRPVFVSPLSIVSTTGAVAPQAARRDTAFGNVTQYASGLRSTATQLSLNLSPVNFSRWGSYTVGYVFSDTRQQSRGFNGSTAGDPRAISWTSGTTPEHQFSLSFFSSIKRHLNVQLTGRINSGTRFTPMVAGDVNGDGRYNDRAFIFSPNDPQLGSALRSLLDASPPSIRRCLNSQLGRIAALNSCSAPWTANIDAFASMNFTPGLLKTSHGVTMVSLEFVNPLSGLDGLLGGALHTETWNKGAYADPTLLYVRGFDAANNTFQYDVNPRFGTARNLTTAIRPPFMVRLDFSISYFNNDAAMRQTLLGGGAGPDGGKAVPPRTATELRARYVQRSPNPYRLVLTLRDSLKLTDPQRSQFDSLATVFTAAVDTAWIPFSEFVTARSDFDVSQATQMTGAALTAIAKLQQGAIETVKTTLSVDQFERLPAWIKASGGQGGRGPGAFSGGPVGGIPVGPPPPSGRGSRPPR